jgi:hypothetical protein
MSHWRLSETRRTNRIYLNFDPTTFCGTGTGKYILLEKILYYYCCLYDFDAGKSITRALEGVVPENGDLFGP